VPMGGTSSTPVVGMSPPPATTWAPFDVPVIQGNTRIQVISASVDLVPLKSSMGDSPINSNEAQLILKVRIENLSTTVKQDYTTWAGADFSVERDYASVEDEHGNIYKRIDFGELNPPVGRNAQDSIYPGKAIEDVLVFEPPVDAAQELHLELPAKNFGGDGMLRILIPTQKLDRPARTPAPQ